MSWVKLDDGFADHPKILDLGDAAFRLHVCALCWAGRRATDGFIAARDLRILGGLLGAGTSAEALAAELVMARLWEAAENGWRIHDFLEYNPSATEVAKKQGEARERMRSLRAKRSERSRERAREQSEQATSGTAREPSDGRSNERTPEGSGARSREQPAEGAPAAPESECSREHSSERSREVLYPGPARPDPQEPNGSDPPPKPPANLATAEPDVAPVERARKDLGLLRQRAAGNWGIRGGPGDLGLPPASEQRLVRQWLQHEYDADDAQKLGDCIALGADGPFKGISCVARWLEKNLVEAVERAGDFKPAERRPFVPADSRPHRSRRLDDASDFEQAFGPRRRSDGETPG